MFESIRLNLPSSYLWIILAAFFAVFLVASLILLYHWRHYAVKDRKIIAGEIIYFLGGAFFIFMALFAAALY